MEVQQRTPERTCIGCRTRAPQISLIRLALAPEGADASIVVVDSRRRLGGRGAWMHPTPQCLELAHRKRAFGRAFRTSIAGDRIEQYLVRANAVAEIPPSGQ